MNHKQHVAACALAMERLHGDQAPAAIAERIGALAVEGDGAGVAMWRQIAAAYQDMMTLPHCGNPQ